MIIIILNSHSVWSSLFTMNWYHNNSSITTNINNLILELTLLELSEIATFDDHNTVISSVRSKRARNQFKNANYILQCTRNKGRFVVPLMMLTHYKGFQVFARHTIHTAS